MRLTAAEQLALGVMDEVVPEPADGAHADPRRPPALRDAIVAQLDGWRAATRGELVEARYARYRRMGAFTSPPTRGAARGERGAVGP